MNNKSKKLVLVVIFAVFVFAAFTIGIILGRTNNRNENFNNNSENIISEGNEADNMSDNIFNLITAWDKYLKADVQCADTEIEINFGALKLDEDFSVKTGMVDDISVSHIQRGKLDIYICDGNVFVEEDNAHFSFTSNSIYSNINMRQIFAVMYEICTKGDFDVNNSDTETVYTLTLSQNQIEEIISTFDSTLQNANVNITKGSMQIETKGDVLSEIKLRCEGYTTILSSQIDGNISLELDLYTSDKQTIELPASILEQLK